MSKCIGNGPTWRTRIRASLCQLPTASWLWIVIFPALVMPLLSCATQAFEHTPSPGDQSMEASDANLKTQLERAILQDQGLAAENIARKLGSQAGSVLLNLTLHGSADVRLATLETAAYVSGPDVCRSILRLVEDSDAEVADLAQSLVSKCQEPELVLEMMTVIETSKNPDVRSVLAIKVGELGGETEIPRLQKLRVEVDAAQQVKLDHDLSIALAKLGDKSAKQEAIDRLDSVGADDRVAALNDVEYINDIDLVKYFNPLLLDYREVVPLALPEEPPVPAARVCDVAVRTMLRLGVKLSYHFDMLLQLEPKHLEEATDAVNRLRSLP
jgi:hypothetical protein